MKNKNIDLKMNDMVDTKHNDIVNSFIKEESKIPKLEKKIALLQKKLDKVKILERKQCIENKIKSLENLKKKIVNLRTDYYLNNSKYLIDYFETKKSINNNNNKKKSLDTFFNISNQETTNICNNNIIKYMQNIDNLYFDINNYIFETDICQQCLKGEMVYVDHEGLTICNNCGSNMIYYIEKDKPSYKEPPKEVCFYAYKRINHFREILAQFQAKETTQIPDKIISDVKQQIQKERISLVNLTNKKTKDILKKLGYNKYYEHIPYIKDKLGISPPIMNPELEDTLCNLFIDIQAPYAKYCPDNRVNFLNYYYTIYKLCELLNEKEFLPYFPMLKDRDKRIEQDEIWKNICKELNWQFIPTL